jgi:TRAP-type mannitol/chloroaromatic compound transport system permease small subunit
MASFMQGEVSQAPAGLPYRWALKFFLPLSFGLLFVAALARVTKVTALLFGVPRPGRPDSETRS